MHGVGACRCVDQYVVHVVGRPVWRCPVYIGGGRVVHSTQHPTSLQTSTSLVDTVIVEDRYSFSQDFPLHHVPCPAVPVQH